MNHFGFILDSDGTRASPLRAESIRSPQPQPQQDLDQLIEQWGLSPAQIEADGGKKASESMSSVLQVIEDESRPLQVRLSLTAMLRKWYDLASLQIKDSTLRRVYFKLTEIIRFILVDPDGDNLIGGQRIAVQLAQLIVQHTEASRTFQEKIYKDIIHALQYVIDRNVRLVESADLTSAGQLRCQTISQLLRCIPHEVDDEAELKQVMALLMSLSAAATQAPVLRGTIASVINQLSLDDGTVTEHLEALLSLAKDGHAQAMAFISRTAIFRSEAVLLGHFDALMDSVDFQVITGTLMEIASRDASKLLVSLNKLVDKLSTVVCEHKIIILGVLLSIAVISAGPFIPMLLTITVHCLSSPAVYVPLCKLLVELSSSSPSAAMSCLSMVVKLIKQPALAQSIHSQLLEAMNIIKDHCAYANLFHPDTLAVLATASAANPSAYKNIVQWNAGKKALRGDKRAFLLSAAAGGSVATASVSAATAKRNIVSPSPQSQSLAVACSPDIDRLVQHTSTPSSSSKGQRTAAETFSEFLARRQGQSNAHDGLPTGLQVVNKTPVISVATATAVAIPKEWALKETHLSRASHHSPSTPSTSTGRPSPRTPSSSYLVAVTKPSLLSSLSFMRSSRQIVQPVDKEEERRRAAERDARAQLPKGFEVVQDHGVNMVRLSPERGRPTAEEKQSSEHQQQQQQGQQQEEIRMLREKLARLEAKEY